MKYTDADLKFDAISRKLDHQDMFSLGRKHEVDVNRFIKPIYYLHLYN